MNKEELKENINKSSKVVGSLLVDYKNKEDEWKNDIIEIKKVNLFALIDQLDEAETLSLDWIDENVVEGDFRGEQQFWYGRFIEEEKVRNLLVPKQEELVSKTDELKPVIPQFVAEWIEESKPYLSLRVAFEYIAQGKKDSHDDEQLAFWVEEGNSETFARAWLDGYTVEKEQEYHVILNQSDDKDRGQALYKIYTMSSKKPSSHLIHSFEIREALKVGNFQFTEKEIKDYDERFWVFAVPVEEEEE